MADEVELKQLREAVLAAKMFFDWVMPKLDMSKSFLGAEEVQIWNDAESKIREAGTRRYLVTFDRNSVYEVEIRASSAADATKKAHQLLSGTEDPSVYALDWSEYTPVEAVALPIPKET